MRTDRDARYAITSLYYYVTPLFIVADYLWGYNVRVSLLDAYPAYKGLYYGFCILCAIGVFVLPRYSGAVALLESSVSVVMAALAFFQPYIRMLKTAENIIEPDFDMTTLFPPEPAVNILMAGLIAVLAFHMTVNQITLEKAP